MQGKIIWMCGLPCSGKTTLAAELVCRMKIWTPYVSHLDGDVLRGTPISEGLGFSREGRESNLLRAATIAKLMSDAGVHVVASFITPFESTRHNIRYLIGPERPFHLLYANAPAEVCEARDVKGMWKKAREGEIKGFTGFDAPFEAPDSDEAHVEINTGCASLSESVDQALRMIGWQYC